MKSVIHYAELIKNNTILHNDSNNISGVGVIAIKNIPNGTNPFKIINNKNKTDNIITLDADDVSKVNKNVVKIIDDFFGSGNKKKIYDILESGPNNINISFYMNHSNKPNIDIIEDNTSNYYGFITNRKILAGEELTIDYSKYEE